MPVYTCFSPQAPTFQPAMRLIANMTNATRCVVTTTFDNQYKTGTIVRLDIPPAVGMEQANQFTGPITVINTTSFFIELNTTNFTPFAIPVTTNSHINLCPLVVPIGENNNILSAAVQNVLPYPLPP